MWNDNLERPICALLFFQVIINSVRVEERMLLEESVVSNQMKVRERLDIRSTRLNNSQWSDDDC